VSASPSPFLSPERQGRRERLRRRKRRRRQAQVALAILALAALAAALASWSGLGRSNRHRPPAAGAPRAQSGQGTRSSGPAAKPDAALPVQLSFHHEPRAGLLFDLDSGRVLWSLNATRVLPIASLTKMMTALLVVRSTPADGHVRISQRAVKVAGSKIGVLPAGRPVALQTLLYGLMLPSGNDAAVALAERAAGGSLSRFVARMNDEARKLGLSCTHYVSPYGLEDANRSCAADLAKLAQADLAEPRIARVARSASAILPLPIKGGHVYLYNNNPLLRYGYPGADGLKTGETEAAGLCLVGTARRGNVRLGVVLLHSPELGRQAEALLDRGFADVYHQAPRPAPPVPKGR
jgi:D-alanyl-D-alanine carboxypeptidase (penicillin-binding protein 5/6)